MQPSPYMKDWPWRVEQYEAELDGGPLIAWRVRAHVQPPTGDKHYVTVADCLDKPTAELIAGANA
jgi:hypothetical protein